jgi:hypothetical protein
MAVVNVCPRCANTHRCPEDCIEKSFFCKMCGHGEHFHDGRQYIGPQRPAPECHYVFRAGFPGEPVIQCYCKEFVPKK